MEILGIDLGNSLVRVCVLSCACCSMPVLVLLLINRAVGGRLSVLPVMWSIIPLAIAQVVNVFAALFDRSKNVDADEVAETRVRRTRSNLRDKLDAANQSFNAQVSGPTQSAQLRSGQPANDPLDPRNQPPSQPGGQRLGNMPQQGGDPRFRGGVDPLARPPQNPNQPQQGGRPPQQRPQQGGPRPPQRRPQQGGRSPQRGGDPRFRGGNDPLAGPPPQNPPMRGRYERRSDDPWETGEDIRSPHGDDAFGPAGLPGLAGRDFSSDAPPPRNPRRDTRRREHNDDEIFGGYFDEDGDGHSDY